MNRRELVALLGGAAIARPLAAHAQQKAIPVIGFLSSQSPGPVDDPFIASFRQGLGEVGYVEGQNVAIEYRRAEGHLDRLVALAAELVERKVDAIAATGGSPAAFAAKKATTTIPIVFSVGVDPVEMGLVTSLARPGGNLTGITVLAQELFPKQIELLSELVPQARMIALLANPNNPAVAASLRKPIRREWQEAANAKGKELQRLAAGTEAEIDAALAVLAQRGGGALLVTADPFFDLRRKQLVALTIRHAVPAIFYNRTYAEAGGLITYGSTTGSAWRQVGVYVGRILSGAKPADLPVQQPTNFELVINLKTAKALGLTIPQSILARADEVIE